MTKRLIDADISDRADGKVPVWSDADNTHVYETPSGGGGAFVGARVRLTGMSLSAGTTTVVSFSSAALHDTDSFHNTGSNPSRLTIPANGYYDIVAYGEFATTATSGRRRVFIRVNGSEVVIESRRPADSVITGVTSTATTRFLSAGDYVEMAVESNAADTVVAELSVTKRG